MSKPLQLVPPQAPPPLARCRQITDADLWPIIELQGFVRYCQGAFLAIPALAKARPECQVTPLRSSDPLEGKLPPDELALLTEHAFFGCLVLCCTTPDGVHPFVFRRKRIKRVLPGCQLIYC